MRWDLATLGVLPFVAVFGAWCSRAVKYTKSPLAFLALPALGALGGFLWAFLARNTSMSLATATIVYDAIAGLSYLGAFIYFGEPITVQQVVGVFLVLGGLALISM